MSNIYLEVGFPKLATITYMVKDIEKAKAFFFQLGWVDVLNNCIRQPGIPLKLELKKCSQDVGGCKITLLFTNPAEATQAIINWLKAQNWEYKLFQTQSCAEIELPSILCSMIRIEKDF